MRAVVAGEYHQRLFVQSQFPDFSQQPADIPIHPGNHGGMAFLRLGPILVRVGFSGGYFHAFRAAFVVGMRNGESQVQEKGIVPAALNERQGLPGQQVVGILSPLDGKARPIETGLGHSIARQGNPLLVSE